MTVGFGSLFTVSNFASMADLAPVLAELPQYTTPDDLDTARNEDRGPSRAAAAHLIEKMGQFKTRSESVYLSNTEKLDSARRLLSDKERVKYLSLFEIAEILLPASLKERDNFPPSALYAVHTALYRDELAFRPLSPTSDCHRRDHLFEIFPSSFSMTINRVATMVRKHCESVAQLSNPSTRTPFGAFVEKARQLVLASRKERNWTAYGMSTPSETPRSIQQVKWSESDNDLLSFLQWWASYELFEPSSRFSAHASTILRALKLYDGVTLDQSVAWTFLQELGIIQPWEIPSRYKVRFPETSIVKGGGLARLRSPNIEQSRRSDIAEDHRSDWSSHTVFCIDGPDAVMIDDGVSLERTDKADEFWIHVHAADPASGIDPNSDLRHYMELLPENIYLQGHFQAMLSDPSGGGPAGETQSLVQEYSLRDGSPALTFSAKVNFQGDVLDYQVKPGRLGKVVYLDPGDTATLCKETQPPVTKQSQGIQVGTRPASKSDKPTRTITSSEDLESADKDQLVILYELGQALRKRRLAKGAWPYFFPRPSVEVRFHELPENTTTEKGHATQPQDPYIKVSDDQHAQSALVTNAMVLAGEVAARWCADRGIPGPFRQDSKSANNFEMAHKYATEVVYPQIKQGVEPTREQRAQLAILTGGIEMSTTPGPYFIMGLDMYMKTTSPLRRFSDLIAHWQIHAALAHERQTGRRIDASQDTEGILPFGKDDLENTLALLHMREKMAKRVSRSDRDWILIALVRAWQFEKTAPRSFRFTVESRWQPGVLGQLGWFGLDASMDAKNIGGHVLLRDIKVGDQFEVELANVNVHSGEVEVRALRYLGSPSASGTELPAASEEATIT